MKCTTIIPSIENGCNVCNNSYEESVMANWSVHRCKTEYVQEWSYRLIFYSNATHAYDYEKNIDVNK